MTDTPATPLLARLDEYAKAHPPAPPRLKTRGFWAHENPEAQKHLDLMNEVMAPALKEAHEEAMKRTTNMLIYGTSHPEIYQRDPWWRRLWTWLRHTTARG